MFEISVFTDRGTKVESVVCSEDQCLVGKDPDCLVTLHGWKVAKRHALFIKRDDGVYIKEAGKTSGIRVNGNETQEFGPLSVGDEIAIHSYRIKVRSHRLGQSSSPEPGRANGKSGSGRPSVSRAASATVAVAQSRAPLTLSTQAQGVDTTKESAQEARKRQLKDLSQHWRERVHKLLLEQLDLRRLNTHELSDEQLREVTRDIIDEVMGLLQDFPPELTKTEIAEQVLHESVGLGPLETLLAQDDVSEIMVNCADEIFYEKAGRLYQSDVTFTSAKSVHYAIERIVAPIGRRIDESSPMVDARLKDGSRVNAVIPPLALKGPCITIRKFAKERLTAQHLVEFGSLSAPMVDFLEMAVRNRCNIIISGGTGSGKTTLLNVLSNFIPEDERIVTVEDAAELRLFQANLISLEARPPNQEGKGAVAIRDLIKNCLRMRPDRIVVGECRGGEALDMLQAMNTGHDGSLTTAHANSPRDCISRLEVMVMMSGMDLPVLAIREQIASAVDLIVQQTRFSCGTRKVTSITEISGVETGRVQMGEIFRFEQSGYDEQGKVKGHLVATGQVPELYERLRDRGIEVDLGIFERGSEL